jgi:hypothetical protein
MFYVFSATIGNRVYWVKDFTELPIMNGVEISYHIYPVYEIGDKNFSLLRERLTLKDGEFHSHYFHFEKYLKEKQTKEFDSLFICGHGESTNVFASDEAYVHYDVETKHCYRVTF